jgi:HEAT repeat protein
MRKAIFIVCAATALAILPAGFAAADDMFIRLTQQGNMEDRQRALDEVDALDARSRKALVPQLQEALKDSNPYTRQNAAEALGALDQFAADTVNDLERLRKDPAEDVRTAASVSLARLGYGDQALVEHLITGLQAQPATANAMMATQAKLERYEAADALGFIASGPKHIDIAVAVPALSQPVLSDPDADVRNRAAWALGTMGRTAHAAIPALRTASRDPEESNVASWALDQIQR